MNPEFDRCLASGKLVEVEIDMELVSGELAEAENDLSSGQSDMKRGDWKWATTKSYYSMFHAAKALVYLKGFKERKSHVCLIAAVRELYVNQGLLPARFVEYLEAGKARREDATYELTYSEEIARTYLRAAEEFLMEAKKLVKGTN